MSTILSGKREREFSDTLLSQKFVEAGAPESSHLQTLGDIMYNAVDRRGHDLHAVFIYFGFLLTTFLLVISRAIPRPISIFGLVAICLIIIYQVLQLYDREFLPQAMILAIPYVPY